MRSVVLPRPFAPLAAAAVVGLALTACGSGSDGAAATSAPSAPAPPVDAARALAPADLPAGATVTTVDPQQAMMAAMQAQQNFAVVQVDPAACKDRGVKAQQEVAETIKAGVQQNVVVAGVNYSVSLLPADARLSVFEDAGSGECATVTLNGTVKQTTTRSDLAKGTKAASGFVFATERKTETATVRGVAAYFKQDDVVALVSTDAPVGGTVDRAAFDDVVERVAAKL